MTVVAAAVGVAAVVVISSLSDYGTAAIEHELDSLGMSGVIITSSRDGEARQMGKTQLDVIREYDCIEAAAPISMRSSIVTYRDKYEQCMTWGVDSAAEDIVSIEILYGRMISQEDVENRSAVCVVDSSLANAIYCRDNIVGKYINLGKKNKRDYYRVVGVAKTGEGILNSLSGTVVPSFVYVPISTLDAEDMYACDRIAVRAPQGMSVPQCTALLDERLSESFGGADYDAQDMAAQRGVLDSILSIVTGLLTCVGSVSLVVAGLGIMTVMTVSVSERRGEIGIKKAIGAAGFQIMCEFLLEALMLSMLGCIAGVGICFGVRMIAQLAFDVTLGISMNAVRLAVLLSVAEGVVFGVFPAVRASRLMPAQALARGE